MKIPSLIRLPKNKRFSFEPRHYDPIKEDIENRIAQIKSEMNSEEEEPFQSTISGAFRRSTERSDKSRPALLQLIIFTILLGGCVAWLIFGNLVLYILASFIPIYLFLRVKGIL